MHKNNLDSSDVFLSYADDEFENYINEEMFRAIVNLYALISDRIVIADSFFINNKIVHDFFENTPDGLKYIENGIIIPLLRDSIVGFNELYSYLYERKTVKRELDHKYIEKIDEVANKSFFKWSENIISKNFTNNILNFFSNEIYFGKFKLNGEKKKILNDIEIVVKNGVLYRQDVISAIKENNKISPDLKDEIINVVDILYNYNIPEYYGLTVAYPDFIHEKSKLIKEIFFR
ncbi:hypothetical protein SAMN02745195_02366 [Thermoanaerobacter uzonensis DSM 18761]|uniref:Uncharacterized protein n=1 Tax=Thermoanaerobacter uzonensis DSM 18761 TaxID=1123369 RepID=A0A1M5AQT3_9THEO|nr:hypothetical protein [Thermoanaerobacter uzonensis]SHF32292.1 hypothetical protein SAMN02745195_02366 [Thermoanaerobacter uzonensis DSM 18761]